MSLFPYPAATPTEVLQKDSTKVALLAQYLVITLLWQKPPSLAPGAVQVRDRHFTFSPRPSRARNALTPFHIKGKWFTEVGLFAQGLKECE